MPETLAESITNASDWLVQVQNKSGGWGQYLGSTPNVLNTAEAILALAAGGRHKSADQGGQIVSYLAEINLGIAFLKAHQIKTSSEAKGAWGRHVGEPGAQYVVPDTIRTGFALLALLSTDFTQSKDVIRDGARWLSETQMVDGGWGYTSSIQAHLFPTCVAMRAIARILTRKAADETESRGLLKNLKAAVAYLRARQDRAEGCFKTNGEPFAHTLHAIQALKAAEDAGAGTCADVIDPAVKWVRSHDAEQSVWQNEEIKLVDEVGNDANYTYTHVTPALYFSALSAAIPAEKLRVRDALLHTRNSIDPATRGFPANRAVTWSTSKYIVGLSDIEPQLEAFPQPVSSREKSRNTKTRLAVLALIWVLAGVGVGAALMDKLTTVLAGLLFATMMVTLLVFQFITEPTFLKSLGVVSLKSAKSGKK